MDFENTVNILRNVYNLTDSQITWFLMNKLNYTENDLLYENSKYDYIHPFYTSVITISSIGVILNILSAIVWGSKEMKSRPGMYFLDLALSDTFYLLATIFFTLRHNWYLLGFRTDIFEQHPIIYFFTSLLIQNVSWLNSTLVTVMS